MTALQKALQDYLALRRGLGTQLRGPEFHLRRFVEFLDCEGAEMITTEIYAKLDFGALRDVALPWPVAGGGR